MMCHQSTVAFSDCRATGLEYWLGQSAEHIRATTRLSRRPSIKALSLHNTRSPVQSGALCTCKEVISST
jgi:hypothetical protein